MHRLTNNLGLKLISLVLAILLWSHVRGEVNPLETLAVDVPLTIEPPRDVLLTNKRALPDKVSVLLAGPRLSLRNVRSVGLSNPLAAADPAQGIVNGSVRATLDFSHARIGGDESDVPVKAESRVDDVDVLGVKPSIISVALDRAQSVRSRVQLQWAPALPLGVQVARATVTPNWVHLFGPSNVLDRVASVRARVLTAGLQPGVEKTLRVRALAVGPGGDIVRGVRLSPEWVSVRALLSETPLTRKLPIVVRVNGTPAAGYAVTQVEVQPAALAVLATSSAFERARGLAAVVDVGGATATLRRHVQLVLPKGISLAPGSRAVAVVTVHLVPLRNGAGSAAGKQAATDATAAQDLPAAANPEVDQPMPAQPPPVRRGG